MAENFPDTNIGNNEYISKQAALECVTYDEEYTAEQIKGLPPADVVLVVRCDDCKYYGSRRWCELHSSIFDDNAFCSYGERREEWEHVARS